MINEFGYKLWVKLGWELGLELWELGYECGRELWDEFDDIEVHYD